MPSPEKFMKFLERFDVSKDIISQINSGFKDITDKSPKKRRAAFFKNAADIMTEKDFFAPAPISTGLNSIIPFQRITASAVRDILILIPNLLIDKVYKESRLKGGKSKPMVLTELVLNGFSAALPHPPQSGGLNL